MLIQSLTFRKKEIKTEEKNIHIYLLILRGKIYLISNNIKKENMQDSYHLSTRSFKLYYA